MGNCLVLQGEKPKKLIKIMMVDGRILEYPSPLKVHQALSGLPAGHAISESLPVVRHLDPNDDMLGGNLYYLLPPKAAVAETGRGRGTSVVRIKVVVSKQELKEMLSKGGVSLGEMISRQLLRRSGVAGRGDGGSCGGWKPVLESIPERNDLC